ncbi:hypothetical protein [uncultured Paracoccus sp.]|uniref:hypothetical protein n=1 Tax=uncultured Paracoccus sp. TaxID=189685 RepID=UPI002610F080|nr:hypothetical protein [uncultured Paracoccus sp.]
MLASFLMGLVGGQRSMTPLAAIAVPAARGDLPRDRAAPRIMGDPVVVAGALALALAELAGDKMKAAPDRIVPAGLVARLVTGGIAGGALAPRGRFWRGAAVGGATAVIASWPGWRARMAAMEDHGQTATGLVEDALVVAGAAAILATLRPDETGGGPPPRGPDRSRGDRDATFAAHRNDA